MIKRSSFLLYCLLFIACISYYAQYKYTISSYDDDVYLFYIPKGNLNHAEALLDTTVYSRPIQTFSDVVESNINSYNNSNGRFIVHSLVQICCSFMQMNQFAIINTIVWGLFVIFLFKVSIRQSYNVFYLLTILCLFWLFVYKGVAFLGNRAGVINYMWCATANLAFYYLYEKEVEKQINPFFYSFLLFLFSVICGSLSESFSIGLSAALVVFCLVHVKKIKMTPIILTIGYLVGTAITVLAPGNFSRSAERVNGLSLNFSALYQIITSPIVLLFLLSLLIKGLRVKGSLSRFCKTNIILFSALCFSACFMLFVAYNGKHQQTFTNILSLVLLSRLLFNEGSNNSRTVVGIAIVTLILSILSYFPILHIRKQLYDTYYATIDSAIKQGGGIIYDKEYERVVYNIRENHFLRDHYVYPFSLRKDFVSMRLTNGKNIHYIEKVVPYETNRLLLLCNSSNEVIKNVYMTDYNIIVLRTKEKNKLDKVSLLFKEKYALFFQRNTLSVTQPYEELELNGFHYYFFPNNNQYSAIEAVCIDGIVI